MNIFVTGGTGYLGKYVVDELLTKHRVCLLTRSKDLKPKENLNIINSDLLDLKDLLTKTSNLKIDCVVHAGAYTPKHVLEKPEKSYETNTIGTSNVVTFAKSLGVKKIIYFSTFSVYGRGSSKPIDEDFKPAPINPYAMSKLFGEDILRFFSKESGVSVITLRLAGVFGGERKDGAIYNFVKNALADQDITVAAPFNFTDSLYVEDVIQVVKSAFELDGFEVFNVSSGEKYTLVDLAKKIIDITNSKSKVVINAPDLHDALQLNLDIFKCKEMLGFNPTNIERAIRKMSQTLK